MQGLLDHLNSLPSPVTGPCVVRSLARPLRIHATANTISAQPAGGRVSPRVFLFSDELIIALAVAGRGSAVIEFSEATRPERTLKGELALPVATPVSVETVESKIGADLGPSVCSGCHPEEQRVPEGWVESIALRPERRQQVEVDALLDLAQTCDPDTQRCATLHALFAGEVEAHDFPEAYPSL